MVLSCGINNNHFFQKIKIFELFGANPWPTLGHHRRGSITHPILISAFLQFSSKGHWKTGKEVGSLRPAVYIEGFELETFQL